MDPDIGRITVRTVFDLLEDWDDTSKLVLLISGIITVCDNNGMKKDEITDLFNKVVEEMDRQLWGKKLDEKI